MFGAFLQAVLKILGHEHDCNQLPTCMYPIYTPQKMFTMCLVYSNNQYNKEAPCLPIVLAVVATID